jgi:hypothetical protein
MRRYFFVLVILVSLLTPIPASYAQSRGSSASAASAVATSASRKAAEGITASQLSDYLNFVASDEMEGRDTPSRGLDTTAKFIATLLARWGVKPAGDNGTFFQTIALHRARVDAVTTHAEINGQAYTYGEDFLADATSGSASGPLVYVGHGWLVKSKDVDAFRGVDVKNKIVVVSGGLPKGVSNTDLSESTRDQDWMRPDSYAKKMGALGVVEMPEFQTLATWDRALRNQQAGGSLAVSKLEPQNGSALPTITLSPRMANALFQNEKYTAAHIFESATAGEALPPFDLDPGKKVEFGVSGSATTLATQNVVGIIEGSDPVLKNEYVAIGAHYDHVGTGPAGSNSRGAQRPGGDRSDMIYNGADDDGSGTVSVLAMAEAIMRAPRRPKRSVLLVWHTGEEKGLWGSEYFVKFPTVPLDRVVAQFNIDMIGRSKKAGDTTAPNRELTGPDEIYVIGSKMMSTELGQLSERVNQSYLNLSFNYKYDDPKDPNRFFFRSDHFNYAQKGIPIIFYFDGVHEDYHRPDDEVQKIDYEKMQKVARTIFLTMWETADLKTRPVVDKKLPSELIEQ